MFSPLEVLIQRSRSLTILLSGSHLLALYCLCIADLPILVTAVMATLLLFSSYRCLRIYLMGLGDLIDGIRFNGARKQISVRCRSDWVTVGKVLSAVVLPYAVILGFKLEGGRTSRYVVVFYDAVSRDDFRRLRVFALYGAYVKDPIQQSVDSEL